MLILAWLLIIPSFMFTSVTRLIEITIRVGLLVYDRHTNGSPDKPLTGALARLTGLDGFAQLAYLPVYPAQSGWPHEGFAFRCRPAAYPAYRQHQLQSILIFHIDTLSS